MAARQFLRVISPLRVKRNYSLLELSCAQQRVLNCASVRLFHRSRPLFKKEEVTFTIEWGDKVYTLKGKEGDSIRDVVEKQNVNLVGYGACEGTLSCSTCHVILSEADFAKLEKASDEELDMLDLAPDVCDTSRLGCQIYLSKKIDGIKMKVPSFIKDLRENPGETFSIKND